MVKEFIKKIFISDYDKKLIECEKQLLEKQKQEKRRLFEVLYKVRNYSIDNNYECSVDTKIAESGMYMKFNIYFNKLISNSTITLVYGNFDKSVNLANVHNNIFIQRCNIEWKKYIRFDSRLNLNKTIYPGGYADGQADISNINWNDFSIAVLLDDKLIYKKDNNCLV